MKTLYWKGLKSLFAFWVCELNAFIEERIWFLISWCLLVVSIFMKSSDRSVFVLVLFSFIYIYFMCNGIFLFIFYLLYPDVWHVSFGETVTFHALFILSFWALMPLNPYLIYDGDLLWFRKLQFNPIEFVILQLCHFC